MSILIFLIALLFASPVEAQVWCGYGRWVNGFSVVRQQRQNG
jgi:hypothetical protein